MEASIRSLQRALQKASVLGAPDEAVGFYADSGLSQLSIGYQKLYEVLAATCLDNDSVTFHLKMDENYPYWFSEDRHWPLNMRPDGGAEYLLYGDGGYENSFSSVLESDDIMTVRYGFLASGGDAPTSVKARFDAVTTEYVGGSGGFALPEEIVSDLMEQSLIGSDADSFPGDYCFLIALCSREIGDFLTGNNQPTRHDGLIRGVLHGICPVWSHDQMDFETYQTPSESGRGYGYVEAVYDGVFYSVSLLGYVPDPEYGYGTTGLCSIRPDFAVRRKILNVCLGGRPPKEV